MLDRNEARAVIDLAAFRSSSFDVVLTPNTAEVLAALSRVDQMEVGDVVEMLCDEGMAEDPDDAETVARTELQTLWTLGLAETMWQNGPWRWTGSRNARYERSNGEGF